MNAIPPFKARLRGAMHRAGLDQSGLARALGASPGVVWGWIEEGILPAGKYMVRLPEVLGVSGHYLLTGLGSELPPERSTETERAYGAGWEAAGAVVREALSRPMPTEALAIDVQKTAKRAGRVKGPQPDGAEKGRGAA